MATTFEPRSSLRSSQRNPSHSQSQSQNNHTALRTSQSASSNPSSLPSVDFGFDSLRHRMGSFTSRIDSFISSGRSAALDERNEHRTRLGELSEDASMRARSISILQGQQAAHSATLAREAAETAEMDGAIASLASSRDAAASVNVGLQGEIKAAREAVAIRESAQREYAEKVARQQTRNGPELAAYEDLLGLRIESPADDEIAFVFVGLGDGKGGVGGEGFECLITLDLSRRDYVVKETSPELDGEGQRERVEGVLAELNETRDLAPFLKGIRRAFVERLKEGRS